MARADGSLERILDGHLNGSAPDRRVSGVAAQLLGNTPAVCRASYIDPRVIDHFLDGRTISSLVEEVDERMRSGHSAEELAVLALLRKGLEERAARR